MRRRTILVSLGMVLAAAGSLAAQGEPAPKIVVIKNMAYSPPAVSVKVGETVTWSNQDDRDHTVAAEDGSFKSGNISAGRSFSHRFAKPGTYRYGCGYHPRMKGTVTVSQ